MTRRRAPRAVALALVVAFAAGCSIRVRARSAAERVHESLGRSVCVLFVDGLSKEAFDRLLAGGALPTIRAELVDRGLAFDAAVASVPSETYPNLAALLTGLFPGHHGIPANVWLDRRLRVREAHTNVFQTLNATDYLAPDARTLYERLPPDTVAVTTPIARGAAVHVKNLVALMASYARYDWSFLDRKTLDDAGDAYAGEAAAGRLPSLVWAHLLGPDEVAHADSPESPEFRDTLAAIDRSFARLVRRLKRRGLYDRVLFVLFGDHGNTSYGTYVDASELVHRALAAHPTAADCAPDCVLVKPETAPGRAYRYDVGDAMIAVGAYRGVLIWLPALHPPGELPGAFTLSRKKRRPKRREIATPLTIPPRSDFAATLARAPEIRVVVSRGAQAGAVDLYGAHGRSHITRQDRDDGPSRYAYDVLEGEDPLGYARVPSIRPLLGRFLGAGEWLRLTADTEFPDLVVQLPEFFDSPRAPDVYLSPNDGFGFTDEKKAGHGSLTRSEMVVPLVFAGPGVPHGRRPVARTVDLAPTLLSWFGIAYDADDMDGEDLRIGSSPADRSPIPAGEEPPE